MKFFGRRNQPAAAHDRSELIKNARFHEIHPPECKKKLAPSVNEVQPIGDELWEDVGVHHDDDADDGCERHGVPEDEAEDGAFVADMRMGLRLSCWAVIFCKPPKRTFEDVSLPVRATPSQPMKVPKKGKNQPVRVNARPKTASMPE